MGRRKLAQLRRTSAAAGWLDVATLLPGDPELAVHLGLASLPPLTGDLVVREILYDNMKTVVTHRDAYGRGRHKFHDALWSLARECGYRPVLCRPYRPQTKGKVIKRSIDYVTRSFLLPFLTRAALEGRVPEFEEINAHARLWCATVANVRIHGTTGEAPQSRSPATRRRCSPCGAADVAERGTPASVIRCNARPASTTRC